MAKKEVKKVREINKDGRVLKQKSVQLYTDQFTTLDKVAEKRGIGAQAIIRELIDIAYPPKFKQ